MVALRTLLVDPTSPVMLTNTSPLGFATSRTPRTIKLLNARSHLEFVTECRKIYPLIPKQFSIASSKSLLEPSYPTGNFGRNQLLGCSISLSPLYAHHWIDLHVRNHYALHFFLKKLRQMHAKLTTFRVLGKWLSLKQIQYYID